mgnify:CR=1 FL=1
MKIKELDEKEYSKFVNKSGNSFMKSYIWGSVMKNKHFIPHYLGLVDDNNKIVASSMLLEKKLTKKYKFYYSPRGFTIDYNDFSLLKEFSLKLKEYMRINHGIFLKIDPDIKRYDLDNSGNILSSETPLIKYLKELGYVHKGFNLDFSHELPRFTFRLDIDKKYEDIVASYHATTRKIYNKGNEYDLDIFIGDESNIDDFYQVMLETSKREDFVCASYDYYKNFYQTLHKYGMTDLYVVKLDVLKLKEIYNSKINDLTEKINVLKEKNNKKNDNKIKELTNELNKVLKDLEYANNIKETNLVLSSIMTVKYMDTVWTLHGGNSSYFRHLNSNYLIYFNIIKDANLNGYKKIDFYGTSGHANPDKSDPIYGIHNFKKRLGGEYMEFIGEFDLVSNKFLYFLFNMTVPLRRKIINKLLRRKR